MEVLSARLNKINPEISRNNENPKLIISLSVISCPIPSKEYLNPSKMGLSGFNKLTQRNLSGTIEAG